MGFFGGIGGFVGDLIGGAADIIVEDIGGGVVSLAGDVVETVEGTVKGALSGDPIAIASLAAMAYGAYSIYQAYAASAATAGTSISTTASTTASTTTTTTVAGSGQVGAQQLTTEALADSFIAAAEQGANPVISEAARTAAQESLKQTVAEATLSSGTDVLTFSDKLLAGAKALATNSATGAVVQVAASALLQPDTPELPTFKSAGRSESFDATPDVQIGAASTQRTVGNIDRSGDGLDNINVLGRLG